MAIEIFSPAETEVIKLIGKRKVTIAQLTDDYFKGKEKPFEPNNYIGAVVRRIAAKCEHHKLNWTLDGEGQGRSGRTVWRTSR